MAQYINVLTEDEIAKILSECHAKWDMPVLSGKRIREIKKSDNFKNYLEKLKILRKRYEKEPITMVPYSLFKLFEETGDRTQYEKVYFDGRKKLVAAVLNALLYGRDKDKEIVADLIWAVCDEYTWCLPAHLNGRGLKDPELGNHFTIDLFMAETGETLAEICHLCRSFLPEIVRKRAMSLVRDRVLRIYEVNTYGWERWRTNWAAVCGGSVSTAAIYAEADGYITERELANIICRTQSTLQFFLEGFPEDGTCGEGVSYWNYGFGHFVYYADMLRRRTCGRIDMFETPHVKKIAEFHQKCFFDSGMTVSFSDAIEGEKYDLGLLSYLSGLYDTVKMPPVKFAEIFKGDPCYRFSREFRHLLWGRTDNVESVAEGSVYLFPNSSWYVATSEDGSINMAAKAGRNDEAHNHNDVGSFLIYKNGRSILSDLGSGEYTKEYFSPDRYNVFCCCSRSHSVPVIGGKYQRPGGGYRASSVVLSEDGISMDMAGAYGIPDLLHFYRTVRFDVKTGRTCISDSFEFANEAESVTERFITRGRPVISDGKVILSSEDGEVRMTLSYDPDILTLKTSEEEFSDHFSVKRTVYCIDLTFKDTSAKKGSAEFIID